MAGNKHNMTTCLTPLYDAGDENKFVAVAYWLIKDDEKMEAEVNDNKALQHTDKRDEKAK